MRRRWYCGSLKYDGVLVQKASHGFMGVQLRGVPKEIAKRAWDEYAKQGNGSQSFESICERNGFSWDEIARLLMDAIERLEEEKEK